MNEFERISARAQAKRERPDGFSDLPKKGENLSMVMTPRDARIPAYLVNDDMWDRCSPVEEKTEYADNPSDLIGLVRKVPSEQRAGRGGDVPSIADYVVRAYSVHGEMLSLYDGGSFRTPDGGRERDRLAVLADEPGAAWLRGDLRARTIAPGDGIEEIDEQLYSVVRNVLVVEGIKGLVAGVRWASHPDRIRRFGAMPVIGFIQGKEGALAGVNWRRVVVRVSRKTRPKIERVIGDAVMGGLS